VLTSCNCLANPVDRLRHKRLLQCVGLRCLGWWKGVKWLFCHLEAKKSINQAYSGLF
jgi:hypothetical protein